jgi:hypothetical protein
MICIILRFHSTLAICHWFTIYNVTSVKNEFLLWIFELSGLDKVLIILIRTKHCIQTKKCKKNWVAVDVARRKYFRGARKCYGSTGRLDTMRGQAPWHAAGRRARGGGWGAITLFTEHWSSLAGDIAGLLWVLLGEEERLGVMGAAWTRRRDWRGVQHGALHPAPPPPSPLFSIKQKIFRRDRVMHDD